LDEAFVVLAERRQRRRVALYKKKRIEFLESVFKKKARRF
jgi:hypothetical protein